LKPPPSFVVHLCLEYFYKVGVVFCLDLSEHKFLGEAPKALSKKNSKQRKGRESMNKHTLIGFSLLIFSIVAQHVAGYGFIKLSKTDFV